MRIRRKKWAEKELEEAEFYIHEPDVFKGQWNEKFVNKCDSIHIELGCGKGGFISKLASSNMNQNYVAVDMIEAMLGLSKRNIEKAYDYALPKNLFLIRSNVEQISNVFDKSDNIDRIYINFCNPWPKKKHNKKRLTHPRQLEQYKQFLKEGGEIYFKTDSDLLFDASKEYFVECGFEIVAETENLHSNDIFEGNVETEHEKMFSDEGINIKALIARLN